MVRWINSADKIRNFQDLIFKEPKCILKEKKSKIPVDLIRLVQCLTVVKAVMNMHVPYNAGNSESEIWPMETLFFTIIMVYCRGAEILGASIL
jgi:hypothetical protein